MANATQTIANEIAKVLSGNDIYNSYKNQWQYLLESYIGGDEYRKAAHLTRYNTETDAEYQRRLMTTPLDNHCQSVVSVYTSFLFREQPYRDLGDLWNDPQIKNFMRDTDHENRNITQFMRELAVWSTVFGHAYIVVAKPNTGAVTRAEEVAQGVRPYLSMLTPLYVLDWEYSRNSTGQYNLDYFKYIEEVNGSVYTVKEWTPELIKTTVVDEDSNSIGVLETAENQLGYIPIITVYNRHSSVRGIGVSDLADIADLQKFIYNAYSEVDQSIRLNTHPSLVKTADTNAGIGAGSVIHVEENLDPGLKPYLLEFTGASIESIHNSIQRAIDAIDKIANTGAVRATETRQMSGYAIETEFQLLNSRLASKAQGLELAEEHMWEIWADYMGYDWQGEIHYPTSFNVRDSYRDLDFYTKALSLPLPSETYRQEIYKHIADITVGDSDQFEDIKQEIEGFQPHMMINPDTGEAVMARTETEHTELARAGWIHSSDLSSAGMNTGNSDS